MNSFPQWPGNRTGSYFFVACTFVGATFIAVAMGAVARYYIQPPSPRFSIETLEHDIGQVLVFEKVTKAVSFKNVGPAPLHIQVESVSCDCTSAELSTELVRPGESATLTANISVKESTGPVATGVALSTNDPSNPSVYIGFKGTAIDTVKATPRSINFGRIAVGDLPVTQTVELSIPELGNQDFSEFELDSSSWFVVASRNQANPSIVEVTLPANAAVGSHSKEIGISFPRRGGYRIRVPVLVEVYGDLWPEPPALFFGATNDDVGGVQTLSSVIDAPSEQSNVTWKYLYTSDQPLPSIEVGDESGKTAVRVTVNPEVAARPLKNTIELTFQRPGDADRKVEIPIIVLAK